MKILTRRENDAFIKDHDFKYVFNGAIRVPNFEVIGIDECEYNSVSQEDKLEFMYKHIWYKHKMFKVVNRELKKMLYKMMMEVDIEDCIKLIQKSYNQLVRKDKQVSITGRLDNDTVNALNYSDVIDRVIMITTLKYLNKFGKKAKVQLDMAKYMGVTIK